MRITFVVFAVLLLLPEGMFCQNSPTIDQMKQMLDASQRRGQLEMEGGAPFHLVASFEWFDGNGRSKGVGKLDELWENSKQYRQTLTLPAIKEIKSADGKVHFEEDDPSLPSRTLTEVDNGMQAWRTGQWVLTSPLDKALSATLQPLFLRSTFSDRLSLEPSSSRGMVLDCIGTEPDLPGVANDVRLALTTYCMSPGNHLLRLISFPYQIEVAFNDVQPFANKFVARSIQVTRGGRIWLKLHVDVLETASDFSSLNAPIPDAAQKLSFHRSEQSPFSGEVKIGQLLKKVSPSIPSGSTLGNIRIKIHVDTTGAVDSAEVLSADNQILKASFLAAIKQWTFRVSYQGTKVIPMTMIWIFHDGTEGLAD